MQNIKPEIVRKGNLLIASKLNLTRNESRVLELVFAQINPFEDVSFQKQYRVEVNDIVKIKKNNRVYMELEDIANGLTSKNIHLRQKDGSFEFLTITNTVKYDADEGAIFVQLNDNLLTYLLKSPTQLENEKKQLELQERSERLDALKSEKAGWAYTSYQLKYHLIIQSNHALRVYELLKQYEGVGKRLITVEDIKILLEIETKYKAYADFKRNIITLAKKELKKKTDICFDFEEIKKRRKVHAIRFTIFKNNRVEVGLVKKSKINFDVVNEENRDIKNKEAKDVSAIVQALKELKKSSDETMTDNKAYQLVNRFGVDYIAACIQILLTEDRKKKNNFVGYVIKAIENNWLDDKIVDIKNKIENQKRKRNELKQQELKQLSEEKIGKMYGNYWNNQLYLLLASVNIDAEIHCYLETKEAVKEYNDIKRDLENRKVNSISWALFIEWLQNHNKQIPFLSIEQFQKQFYANQKLKPRRKVINKNDGESIFSYEEMVNKLEKRTATLGSFKNKGKKASKIPLSNIKELAEELGHTIQKVAIDNGYKIEGDFAVKYDS